MIDNQSIAVHAFIRRILILFSLKNDGASEVHRIVH